MGEATTTASSGAYETPRFWAKDKKNQRFAKQRWMPGAKYVKVKDKCKTFPYCNQGDIDALEIWEKEMMRESAKNVAKKTPFRLSDLLILLKQRSIQCDVRWVKMD